MYLEPHHVREIRSCGGGLIAAAPDPVTTRSDCGKTFVIHANPSTIIWRGEIFHATSVLRRGDDITASGMVHYPDEHLTGEEIWANLKATEGVIRKVLPDRIIVDQYPGAEKHSAYPRGRATVMLDAHTRYVDGARADRKAGRSIRAVGLEIGKHGTSRFLASTITLYE